ncbi:unnamed protein product [Lupinus luteus]|uniref:Bifunctional inhibitor/plant lipid transfer protein/seed storage helical domain-containing protein n=1 Tax=Lupinus luteus TaxID=3873 RepID=A0AAV1X8Z7_LUPLU
MTLHSSFTQIQLCTKPLLVQLSPCVSTITSSSAPSNLCCSKIKEQKPCLCQYLQNPNLKSLLTLPLLGELLALVALPSQAAKC